MTDTKGYNYIVRFKNVDKVPNLSENEQLKDKIHIINCIDDMYMVTSFVNDAKLKEILMTDYSLKAGQVIVQTSQGFVPLSGNIW